MRHTRRIIGGLFVVACATLAAQQAGPARSSAAGIYTAAQAAAGEKVYFEKCASCHGDDLAGRERAPALTGTTFVEGWAGKDLRLMLDRFESMPPTAPKSLSAAEYVSLLAFVLRQAEMPAGPAPLPADRAQLATMTFARAPGAVASAPAAGNPPNAAAPPAPAAPGGAAPPRPAAAPSSVRNATWTTYGGNLASQRYSAAENRSAFSAST